MSCARNSGAGPIVRLRMLCRSSGPQHAVRFIWSAACCAVHLVRSMLCGSSGPQHAVRFIWSAACCAVDLVRSMLYGSSGPRHAVRLIRSAACCAVHPVRAGIPNPGMLPRRPVCSRFVVLGTPGDASQHPGRCPRGGRSWPYALRKLGHLAVMDPVGGYRGRCQAGLRRRVHPLRRSPARRARGP